MKRKIIFATSNQGKLKEIRMIFEDSNIDVCSAKEAGIDIEVIEDGKTFAENAFIKAKKISELSGEIVLADDSGLEIDFLNKEPGIYSARYMGEETSYLVKNTNIINRLEKAEENQRTARFVCAIAAVLPTGESFITEGTMEGVIGHEIKGENGFGYDPIFYIPEFKCTTAELDPVIKNQISHRGKALKEMKIKLKQILKS